MAWSTSSSDLRLPDCRLNAAPEASLQAPSGFPLLGAHLQGPSRRGQRRPGPSSRCRSSYASSAAGATSSR
jgi:hypothetical protein